MSRNWNLPDGLTPEGLDRALGYDDRICDRCKEEVDELEDMMWRGRRLRVCTPCAVGYEDAGDAEFDRRREREGDAP